MDNEFVIVFLQDVRRGDIIHFRIARAFCKSAAAPLLFNVNRSNHVPIEPIATDYSAGKRDRGKRHPREEGSYL